MKDNRAFICHGGLGDLYVQLLQIKDLESETCDVYYCDELGAHAKDITALYKSQSEIKNIYFKHVKHTPDFLEQQKTKMLQHYSEVIILDSKITNISTAKSKIQLPNFKWKKKFITINTGAGNFNLPEAAAHNVNRRWPQESQDKLIDNLTKLGFYIVLLGKSNSVTKSLFNAQRQQVVDARDKNIIDQLNFIKHAALNIVFEGFTLKASVSFQKLTIVKNNPPLFDFRQKDIYYLDELAYKNMYVVDDYKYNNLLPILILLALVKEQSTFITNASLRRKELYA
jgi:hypothetical protein